MREGADLPEGWINNRSVFFRQRRDFLLRDIVPSVSTVLEGSPIRSNHFGMSDREYDQIKPANVYRIVLLGVSHDQGIGVKQDETYENLDEDRWNRGRPDARIHDMKS
jgi:alginate O-acetyltransferase complex protein AlgI